MGKYRENYHEKDYGDDEIQAFLDELDLDWGDKDAEYARKRNIRTTQRRNRDARRKIERYREERDLESRLREYYDD